MWGCRWGGIWYQGILLASFLFRAYYINYISEWPSPSKKEQASVAFFLAYCMCLCVCDGSCNSIRWGGSWFNVSISQTQL